MPEIRDLLFESSTHEIIPTLELGIFRDLWLSARMPVILHDTRSLSFDQRATPCTFPGGGATPTCVNKDNSSTILDGLLPETGFDANDPNGPGFTSGSTIFEGPARRGTTQLHLGVGFAPMNQKRDPSKPTWKLGAEVRLPIGATKRLNRFEPDKSNAVSEGVTHIHLWTSMAKHMGWAEPYVDFWWQAPLTVKSDAPLAPLEQKFGVSSENPQQSAGAGFGVDATLWSRPEDNVRVGLDFNTRLTAFFEGRGYSDMWEVFQYAGNPSDPNAPLVLDREPTVSGVQAMAHPGVTNIENFMTLDTQLQLTAQSGDKIRFSAGVGFQFEQSHLISYANAGTDLPQCGGAVVINCENNDNVLVDANTEEVNPLHAPTIDLAGHRFRVAQGRTLFFSLAARILF
jgi:hypothetical protein